MTVLQLNEARIAGHAERMQAISVELARILRPDYCRAPDGSVMTRLDPTSVRNQITALKAAYPERGELDYRFLFSMLIRFEHTAPKG